MGIYGCGRGANESRKLAGMLRVVKKRGFTGVVGVGRKTGVSGNYVGGESWKGGGDEGQLQDRGS